MPSRALDLAALGLASEEKDVTAVRRAFLRKSKTAHPDKGGTKEQFVALKNAYERLLKNVYAAPRAPPPRAGQNNHGASGGSYHHDAPDWNASFDDYDWDEESHYDWYDDWFGENYEEYDEDNDESHDDWFDAFYAKFTKREMNEEERRARRQNFLKRHKDPLKMDKKAKPGEPVCHSCRYHRGITEDDADYRGVDFGAYSAHPKGRITCWICKLSFESVTTQCKAESKSWRDAEGNRLGKVLEGKGVIFRALRGAKKTFCQQPKSEYVDETRLTEYFWVEDLQDFAEQLPAIPRTPKKKRVSENAVPGTPPRRQKKSTKRKDSCDDDDADAGETLDGLAMSPGKPKSGGFRIPKKTKAEPADEQPESESL